MCCTRVAKGFSGCYSRDRPWTVHVYRYCVSEPELKPKKVRNTLASVQRGQYSSVAVSFRPAHFRTRSCYFTCKTGTNDLFETARRRANTSGPNVFGRFFSIKIRCTQSKEWRGRAGRNEENRDRKSLKKYVGSSFDRPTKAAAKSLRKNAVLQTRFRSRIIY